MTVTAKDVASLWALSPFRSDKGLTLEMPDLKIFTVANLSYLFS